MGFRNPVTSVSSLDTGQGFARGSVETFTDNPTGPLGTPLHTAAGFLFRDGITGDAPAAVVNEAYYVAQGGNALTAQGGSLTVAAGSYNGVAGPELDLNVDSVADGWTGQAWLRNAKRLDLGGAVLTGAGGVGVADSPDWIALALLNGFAGSVKYRVRNNVVYVATSVSRAAWSGFLTAAVMPVGLRPATNVPGLGMWAGVVSEADVNANGNVAIGGPGSYPGAVASHSYPL